LHLDCVGGELGPEHGVGLDGSPESWVKHLVDLVIQIVSSVSNGTSCESNLMSTVIDVLQSCRNVGIGKILAGLLGHVRCGGGGGGGGDQGGFERGRRVSNVIRNGGEICVETV
jgi:hypothetical protein